VSNPAPGGHCSAEFSFNHKKTHLNQLITVLGILEISRQVCLGKLELISTVDLQEKVWNMFIVFLLLEERTPDQTYESGC